jgi:CheY-like chemotaxis protein
MLSMAALGLQVSGVRMKRARILVIDDEPSVIDALKIILSDKGYDTAVAASGSDALDLARRHQFDIAIVDFKLPDLSGVELFPRLAEKCPDVDGILVTAYDSAEVRANAAASGFAAVLAKPFSPRDLLDVLSGILSRRRPRSGVVER